MIAKEILKEAFDNDKEVLETCFKQDIEFAEIMRTEITKIWVALLGKGIVQEEEIKAINEGVKKAIEERNRKENNK